MAARRFKLEIAGETVFGLAFPSEAELEAFLIGRPVVIESAIGAAPAVRAGEDCLINESEPRPRGRPSRDLEILAVADRLGEKLDELPTASARARLVLRELARTLGPDELPSRRTVERFLLGERPVRQKPRQKSRQNS